MDIKQPKTPLAPGYRPAGSIPYKVKTGDSWRTVAAAHGVDAAWLIQYNFETRSPAEVNWYLKNRTGCKTTTLDGRNFKFSHQDQPGTIYVPTPLVVRGLTSLRYGPFGISIEGDEDYQKQVESTLAWIARSDTGMVLLKAIQRTGKPITVSAWTGKDCNATAGAISYQDSTPKGEVLLKGGNSFEQVKEPSLIREFLGLPQDPVIGTGKGSGAKVKFSPRMFGYGSTGACSAYAGLPGASPSQVLFHELGHAYRMTGGRFHTRPTVGGSAPYDNMEEFFAVVLSNVLTSDPTYSTGNRSLRADHWGFTALAPNLSTSRGFVSHIPNRNMMRELATQDPDLTNALKGVGAYFNPFAEAV